MPWCPNLLLFLLCYSIIELGLLIIQPFLVQILSRLCVG